MQRIFFTIIIALGFFCCGQVLAADYYVNGDSGSDIIGSGSINAPYKTITKALTVAVGSNNIYCRGTINDSLTITASNSGTSEVYTTITTWPGFTATLNSSGNDFAIAAEDGASHIRIENLNITGANNAAIYIVAPNTDYWDILNNNIYGLTEENSISMYFALSNHSRIVGNDFNGNNRAIYGMYYGSLNDLAINNNKIHNYTTFGIAVDGLTSDVDISNNWFYNIGGVESDLASTIIITDSYNYNIYHNTFYHNYHAEFPVKNIVLLAYHPDDIYNINIKNNIFNKINTAYYLTDDVLYGIDIDDNSFFQVDNLATIENEELTNYSRLTDWQTAKNFDVNSIAGDPLFVSITAGTEDLHLQETSPCIDTGEVISSITQDFDGEIRPYNQPDIGADERPIISFSPKSLAAIPMADTANLSWLPDSSNFTNEYLLKLSKNADLTANTQTTITAINITLTDLQPAQTYYYAIQGIYHSSYATYYSPYSEIHSFTTFPDQVSQIKIPLKHLHKHQITVKWHKQSNVSGYIVKLMDHDGHKIKYYYLEKNKAKKIIQQLNIKTKYQIQIRSKLSLGNSYLLGDWSKTKKFTTR